MKIDDVVKEFKKQLRLRGYSYNTIETYGSCATIFLVKFKESKPTKSDIENWLLNYKSEVYRKHLLCSVKSLNKYIFTGNIDCDSIPYPRPNSLTEQALIKQFSDSDVVLKKIIGDKLVEEKVSLMDFWDWQPVHIGTL